MNFESSQSKDLINLTQIENVEKPQVQKKL
jgi:hypothetical protein